MEKNSGKMSFITERNCYFCSVMERIFEENDHNASPLDFFIAFSVLATAHSKRFVTAFNGVREGQREFDFRVLQGFVDK